MNVIFLDFDGVLNTIHYSSNEDVERRISTLSDICHKYDAKVVICAASKDEIDEVTLETYNEWIKFVFDCFKKYNIECIGRTPNVRKRDNNGFYKEICKEDEVRLYLYRHPEVTHYCVIDDDDFSDLNKIRNHLVKTLYYSSNKEEEGLLASHIDDVGEKLQEENEILRLIKRKSHKK